MLKQKCNIKKRIKFIQLCIFINVATRQRGDTPILMPCYSHIQSEPKHPGGGSIFVTSATSCSCLTAPCILKLNELCIRRGPAPLRRWLAWLPASMGNDFRSICIWKWRGSAVEACVRRCDTMCSHIEQAIPFNVDTITLSVLDV